MNLFRYGPSKSFVRAAVSLTWPLMTWARKLSDTPGFRQVINPFFAYPLNEVTTIPINVEIAAPDSVVANRGLAEVKAIGARNSATRSADQSVAAVFWNSGEDTDGLPFFQRIADARKLSSLDFTRMMALSDMADFDSRIVYVGIKDKYRYWRPVNAIRGKFADASVADAAWESLIAAPPNPDYPSGGGVGGGFFIALLTTFDPDGKVPLSWKNTAIGVTRTWPNAQAMAAELAASRVWGGIHFRNSVDTGYRIGKRVAEEVFSTQLRPLPGKSRWM